MTIASLSFVKFQMALLLLLTTYKFLRFDIGLSHILELKKLAFTASSSEISLNEKTKLASSHVASSENVIKAEGK